MSVLLFFLVLFVLVIAHEFGHFIIAKMAGIRVDEFAFGFPPRLGSITKGETRYSFNALPLGGYVKIYGENPDEVESGADASRSFTGKPRIVQASVIVAGVVFNLLLAWLLIASTLMIGINAPQESEGITAKYPLHDVSLMVTGLNPGSPAETSGIKSGDVIVSLSTSNETVDATSPDAVIGFIAPREAQPVTVTYLRKGEMQRATVLPVSGLVPDRAAIGISMDMVGTLRLPPHVALWEGFQKTVQYTVLTVQGLWDFLSSIVVGQSDFSQVTGPVGIVRAVGEAAGVGLVNLILFTAIISINLAVINVLPFPALDGGRLLFIVIEAVMRRPIRAQVANVLNIAGFALLMLLMIVVTYKDLVKLFA